MKKNIETQVVELLQKPQSDKFKAAINIYDKLLKKGFIKKTEYNLPSFADKAAIFVEFNKPFSAPKSK